MKTILETERMLLREFVLDDAPFAFELNKDWDVIKYTGDVAFESIAAAQEFILGYKDYELNAMGRWLCILKSSGESLGWCGLKLLRDTEEVDLGYRFLKKHWGKGFATEASIACLHYGFGQLKLDEIIGRAQLENKASIKVLQKTGMKFAGNFEFDLHPGVKYSITKTEFLQQQKNRPS